MGAKGSEVFDRQRTAARLHVGRDAARKVTIVEIARPRIAKCANVALSLSWPFAKAREPSRMDLVLAVPDRSA
jgi:hypothetical protein